MKKDLSKQSFFHRLSLRLSFYFTNEECNSILSDYEEWFENEADGGKSEQEICAALEKPEIIVKKLFLESGSSSSRFFVIFHNPVIQALLLSAAHLFAITLLLMISSRSSYTYYPFRLPHRIGGLLLINLLYFIAGRKIIKKSHDARPNYFIRTHLLLFLAVILFIPLVFILAYLPNNPAFYGPAYVNSFSAMILIGYIAMLSLIARKILQNRQFTQFTFSMLLHISGMISVLAFLISQHNYNFSWSEFFLSGACGTFVIYAEIFVLCLLCLKKGVHTKGE